MSPFPAAMARARSEFGAGSGFVVAVKPPCTIGKTSLLVMPCPQQTRGHDKGRKTPDFHETAATVCEIFNQTGSATLKPCIATKKHKKHKALVKVCLCLLCSCVSRVRLTVGLRSSYFDSTRG